MSEVQAPKVSKEQLDKVLNSNKRLNHHVNSQRTFMDEVISQNLALRTNASLLNESVQHLSADNERLQALVKELESKLEAATAPAPAQTEAA